MVIASLRTGMLRSVFSTKRGQVAPGGAGGAGGGAGGPLAASTSFYTTVFVLAILWQICDFVFLRFGRTTQFMISGTLIALIAAVGFGVLLSHRHGDGGLESFFKSAGIIFLLTFITVILPWVVQKFFSMLPDNFQMFWFVYALTPIWALYAMFSPESPDDRFPAKVRPWYVVFWMFILVFAVGGSIFTNFQVDATMPEAKLGMTQFWDYTTDSFERTMTKITKGVSQTLNGTDAFFYTGQVEKNPSERFQLGVRLEQVEPIDPFFIEGNPAIIHGYISAMSFLSESVWVEPSCRIDRDIGRAIGFNYPSGVISNPVAEVYFGADELFECRFAGTLDQGNYPVVVDATFEFETWSDITYTFVTEEKARNLARLQKDIYQELEITQDPPAIYTDGPVSIGMGGSRMPIRVDTTRPYLQNAYLGFTLQSRWPTGEIKRVKELIVLVPNGFSLTECDRRDIPGSEVIGPEPDREVPSYDRYTFKNTAAADVPYHSVRCKLQLDNPDKLPEIFQGSDKSIRTFIVMAKYDYTVSARTQFTVKE